MYGSRLQRLRWKRSDGLTRRMTGIVVGTCSLDIFIFNSDVNAPFDAMSKIARTRQKVVVGCANEVVTPLFWKGFG